MQTLELPPDPALLSTHKELQHAIQELERRKRWKRLLSHPVRTLVNHFGAMRLPVHHPDFVRYNKWPDEVRRQLMRLPKGFVTSYSLQPDSAHWLFELIRRNDFSCVIECGCGVSTVIISLAIGSRPIRFYSLEHDQLWLGITRRAMEGIGMENRVNLIHSPLTPVRLGDDQFQAPAPAGIGDYKADLLLIDAPPSETGRTGVLPSLAAKLKPQAMIILDDAARSSEAESIALWEESRMASLEGFKAIGTGLAILRSTEVL